ncbi:MAG TPA: TSUP family transporter [Candidatus Dormibacteraeota bacterium]|nr:TSUP family transporter [Candidatus Dormibacteraeota bacterium]
MTDALAVLSGLLIGALSGLIGIGGGVLLVPLLVIGFGFSQQVAQGTSLAALIPTSIVGAVTHLRQGNLDVRAGVAMGLAGMVGAAGAALVAQHLHGKILERLFGLLLLFAAYRLWRRG